MRRRCSRVSSPLINGIVKDEDNPVMHLLEKLQASPAIIGGVSFSTKAA
jgi:hypothetical protein